MHVLVAVWETVGPPRTGLSHEPLLVPLPQGTEDGVTRLGSAVASQLLGKEAMNDDQLIASSNEDLAFYISTLTKQLTEAIGETYRREADTKQAQAGESLSQLAFAASTLLGFGPGLQPGSETDVTLYDTSDAGEETTPDPEPDALKVSEIADIFGVGPQTIRNMLKNGTLRKVGKSKQGKPTFVKIDNAFYREAGNRGITTFPWSAA